MASSWLFKKNEYKIGFIYDAYGNILILRYDTVD